MLSSSTPANAVPRSGSSSVAVAILKWKSSDRKSVTSMEENDLERKDSAILRRAGLSAHVSIKEQLHQLYTGVIRNYGYNGGRPS